MQELQIIKGVQCYIDKNGVAQLNLEDVARGLGFTTVATSGNEVVGWNRVNQYLADLEFSPQMSKDDFIPEPIFYLLAMKASNETAKEFQKIVAYEILPSIRKHGLYAIDDLLENPDLAIKAFMALKEEKEKNKVLELENKVQAKVNIVSLRSKRLVCNRR